MMNGLKSPSGVQYKSVREDDESEEDEEDDESEEDEDGDDDEGGENFSKTEIFELF